MRRVTRIAAAILLADISDHRFGMFSLDLKSCNKRIFGLNGDMVRLPLHFKPDGKLHLNASLEIFWGYVPNSARVGGDSVPLWNRVLWASPPSGFGISLRSCPAFRSALTQHPALA